MAMFTQKLAYMSQTDCQCQTCCKLSLMEGSLPLQVSVAIMLAPVTFLGHIISPAVAAMATMQTDQVCTAFVASVSTHGSTDVACNRGCLTAMIQ